VLKGASVTDVTRPVCGREGLLEQQVGDELVVYDVKESVACGLNATAAAVWRLADGSRTVPELAESLRDQIGDLADEDLVMITLDRLDEQGLIADGYAPRDVATSRFDRRRFIRRAGVVGAAALALPVVQSIVAPTVAAATSACSCGCGGELGPNKK
jgi:hypothetical protein